MPERNSDERLAEQRFGRKVLTLMALGFVAVLAAAVFAGLLMARGQDRANWVDHTYQVERAINTIRFSLEEMRSTRRGYFLNIAPGQKEDYYRAVARFQAGIRQVEALTIDNPVQQGNGRRLDALAAQMTAFRGESMRRTALASPMAEAGRQDVGREVSAVADAMLAEEARLLIERRSAQVDSFRQFYWVLALTMALLVIVAIGSFSVIRRYTHDLNVSRAQLRRLNENLEGAVRERTTDLQRANDEIQRFAYIVSHDLRSPLVNVMGFTAELDASTKPLAALIDKADAEAPGLVSTDARLAAKEDLPEAIRFIRTSTQKMDRLINAILRLSREGRRTVTPEAIDVVALTDGVVDALRHRIDELGATVTVARTMPIVTSDRLALEQILSNLIENALKYLQPGRAGVIAVKARAADARVLIDVIDNGRGIDPRDHDRVFDLFRRSGPQDQPGEGIGLAHVRAQAYRIGGTIGVTSELDKGATFHLNLPVVFTEDKKVLS